MLEYMSLTDHAEKIKKAVFEVLDEKKFLTGDLGGSSTTRQFTDAIIKKLY
jgi:isocitrate dehydrogenase (NAD+)